MTCRTNVAAKRHRRGHSNRGFSLDIFILYYRTITLSTNASPPPPPLPDSFSTDNCGITRNSRTQCLVDEETSIIATKKKNVIDIVLNTNERVTFT